MKKITLHDAILRSMSDAVFVVGHDLHIYYANPEAERIFGHSIDGPVAFRCNEIFCRRPQQCDDNCQLVRAIKEAAPVILSDLETCTKQGELRMTRVSISPYFDGESSTGSVIIIKDISDLKDAEDKIQRQKDFLDAVINALPHPLYVINAENYRLKYANMAAFPGELPSHITCHALSHRRIKPCSGSEHPCLLDQVKQTGQPCTVEHVHTQCDGSAVEVEVHGFPIFDEDGNMKEMIEYCIDISDSKQAARERESLICELQHALGEVKALSGLLPLCSSCKKIRDDNGNWNILEQYISSRTDAEFSHSICPDCVKRIYPDFS